MFSSQLHNTVKYVPVTVIIHLMNRMGDPEGTCKDHLTQYSQLHVTEWSPRAEKELSQNCSYQLGTWGPSPVHCP